MPPFPDAQLRLERADQHLAELSRRVDDYVERWGGESFAVVHGHTVTATWVPAPEPSFGVVVGDVVHSLRSALDNLVYRVAWLDSGEPQERTQFPIADTPEEFARRRNAWLRGVSDAHIAWLEEYQPYAGAGWAAMLRDLSNIDKHRAIVLAAYTGNARISVGGTEEHVRELGGVTREHDPGAVYFPAELAVVFEFGLPVVESLREIAGEVRAVVDRFAAEVDGNG